MGNEMGKETRAKILADVRKAKGSPPDGSDVCDTEETPRPPSPPVTPLSIFRASPLANIPLFSKSSPPTSPSTSSPNSPTCGDFSGNVNTSRKNVQADLGILSKWQDLIRKAVSTKMAEAPEEDFDISEDLHKFLPDPKLEEDPSTVLPPGEPPLEACSLEEGATVRDVRLSYTVEKKLSADLSVVTEYSIDVHNQDTASASASEDPDSRTGQGCSSSVEQSSDPTEKQSEDMELKDMCKSNTDTSSPSVTLATDTSADATALADLHLVGNDLGDLDLAAAAAGSLADLEVSHSGSGEVTTLVSDQPDILAGHLQMCESHAPPTDPDFGGSAVDVCETDQNHSVVNTDDLSGDPDSTVVSTDLESRDFVPDPSGSTVNMDKSIENDIPKQIQKTPGIEHAFDDEADCYVTGNDHVTSGDHDSEHGDSFRGSSLSESSVSDLGDSDEDSDEENEIDIRYDDDDIDDILSHINSTGSSAGVVTDKSENAAEITPEDVTVQDDNQDGIMVGVTEKSTTHDTSNDVTVADETKEVTLDEHIVENIHTEDKLDNATIEDTAYNMTMKDKGEGIIMQAKSENLTNEESVTGEDKSESATYKTDLSDQENTGSAGLLSSSASKQTTTLPTQSSAPPTQSLTPPTQVSTLPTQVSTPPTQVSTLPTQVSTLPTQSSTSPTQSSTPPTQSSTAPTQSSTPPTQVSTPLNQASSDRQTPSVGEEENVWKTIENLDLDKILQQVEMSTSLNDEGVDCKFPVQGFEKLSDQAEHRLAARRAARQEAREIRMREIERQQKEAEEKEGRSSSTTRVSTPSSRYTPRQDSDDSTTSDDMRVLKKELYSLEEKYTKAMMDNAQLDNEKQMLRYEVDLFKDRVDDLTEELIELQRENKDKNRELEQKKRHNTDLTDEVGYLKQQLKHRDQLIEEYGLVFISNDTVTDEDNKDRRKEPSKDAGTTALVTPQASEILKKHQGSLDERLKKFEEERSSLLEEIKKLKQQLDQEKERSALAEKYSTPRVHHISNGPDVSEIQMESQRLLNEYKFKLKKAEQDITTLEGNVSRLESQAKRYKQLYDESEKNEEDLKLEKRKLLREFREAQSQVEELQTQNQHLVKRMDKMKSARNAILKS